MDHCTGVKEQYNKIWDLARELATSSSLEIYFLSHWWSHLITSNREGGKLKADGRKHKSKHNKKVEKMLLKTLTNSCQKRTQFYWCKADAKLLNLVRDISRRSIKTLGKKNRKYRKVIIRYDYTHLSDGIHADTDLKKKQLEKILNCLVETNTLDTNNNDPQQ